MFGKSKNQNQNTGNFTGHASFRVSGRLSHLVDQSDIDRIEWAAKFYQADEKVYFEVKTFSKVQHIDENGYSINGDAIVAVLKFGRVATVMLAKSWRKEYFADGFYTR